MGEPHSPSLDSNELLHDSLVSEVQNSGIGGWINGLGLTDLMPDVLGGGITHSSGWCSPTGSAPGASHILRNHHDIDDDDGYRSPDADRVMEQGIGLSSPEDVGAKRKLALDEYGRGRRATGKRAHPMSAQDTPPSHGKAAGKMTPPTEERVGRASARVARVSSLVQLQQAAAAASTSSAEDLDKPTTSSSSGRGHRVPTRHEAASPRGVVGSPQARPLPDKTDKGLRSFSLKVCQKVEQKNKTTYAEVADELVIEMMTEQGIPAGSKGGVVDDKNIRRRVYDALNVLLAIDVVEKKDKKNVEWRGFPASSAAGTSVSALKHTIEEMRKKVQAKQREAAIMAGHYVRLSSLASRNAAAEEQGGVRGKKVQMPFVLVQAPREEQVVCGKSADKQDVTLTCGARFELLDDKGVLEHMDLLNEDNVRSVLAGHDPEVADLLIYGVPGGDEESEGVREEDIDYDNE